jgi:FecR protein
VVRRMLAIVLSVSLSGLPSFAADQTAGKITALIPAATRNAQPTQARDALMWNDLLQTTQSGRLRAGLTDGSILSLGSNAELKVIQHDADSQQTSLELNYGKLRNRVVKITQPNGKYEVKTPNAVIGVIGTDFYVAYENNMTTVICYSGQVTVTSLSEAKVVHKSNQANSQGQQTILSPQQVVVIGTNIPPGGFPPESEMIQASITETNVSVAGLGFAAAHPLLLHGLLLGVMAGAVGAAAGVAASQTTTFHSNVIPPPVVCGANTRAKCGQ